MITRGLLAFCFLPALLCGIQAQDAVNAAPLHSAGDQPRDAQTVIVTGVFEPIPVAESNRVVVLLDTVSTPLNFNSVIDYLHDDASVDLRQRGGDGTQADISIRGSLFSQTLILLNGLRINDAQTGHHNLDIPLPLEAISRIEVLHGSGSTLYGADALGGAVNFVTTAPQGKDIRLRVGGGNFGFNQQRVIGALGGKWWSERVVASRDASSGFQADRDYSSSSASSETWLTSRLGTTAILLAGSDRPFGADQFYGAFNSWERTKSWFASIHQEFGPNTSAAFGYRRHTDVFTLFRDHPLIYQNNHISQSWEGAIRRQSAIVDGAVLAYGIEADADEIDSNNLGHHGRNRGAGYANLDAHIWQRVLLSVGGRDEVFSGGRNEFVPTIAAGVHLNSQWNLRGSVSRGFRLPTYTDLYYSDPATQGNPLLKPESAWNFEAGPEWRPNNLISAQVTVFHRRDRDVIDYVQPDAGGKFLAMNVQSLNFTGAEALLFLRLPRLQNLQLGYTGLHASRDSPSGLSRYAFTFANHNAFFAWSGQVHQLSLRNRVAVVQRYGQGAYPLWDFSAARSRGRVRPYLQLANLSNTGYEEIPNVAMQGRSVLAGVELVFSAK